MGRVRRPREGTHENAILENTDTYISERPMRRQRIVHEIIDISATRPNTIARVSTVLSDTSMAKRLERTDCKDSAMNCPAPIVGVRCGWRVRGSLLQVRCYRFAATGSQLQVCCYRFAATGSLLQVRCYRFAAT